MGFVIFFAEEADFEPEIAGEDSWMVEEDKDMEKGTYKGCKEPVDLTFLFLIIYCIINVRQKYLKAAIIILKLYKYILFISAWLSIL